MPSNQRIITTASVLSCAVVCSQTIKINWKQGNGFATPILDLGDDAEEENSVVVGSTSESANLPVAPILWQKDPGPLASASVSSLNRLLLQVGAVPSVTEDDVRSQTLAELRRTKASRLKQLLKERGAQCAGCTTREELVNELLRAADDPISYVHALPLFLFNEPLYPHTNRQRSMGSNRHPSLSIRAVP